MEFANFQILIEINSPSEASFANEEVLPNPGIRPHDHVFELLLLLRRTPYTATCGSCMHIGDRRRWSLVFFYRVTPRGRGRR